MRVARTTVWRRPGRMRRKTRRLIDRWCCSTAGKVQVGCCFEFDRMCRSLIRRSYEYTVYIGVYYSWLHSGILAWTFANIHLLIVNYFIIAIRRSADFLHGDFIIIGRQIPHRWLPPMIRRSPFQMQCVRREICCCIFLRLLQLMLATTSMKCTSMYLYYTTTTLVGTSYYNVRCAAQWFCNRNVGHSYATLRYMSHSLAHSLRFFLDPKCLSFLSFIHSFQLFTALWWMRARRA